MAGNIPEDYRRVLEGRIDEILGKHLSALGHLSSWMFGRAFGRGSLLAIEGVALHQHRDFRKASGNPLAFGETDVEVIARIATPDHGPHRVGLLIEDKVDAKQMLDQGRRYRARGDYQQANGQWQGFRSILVAPQWYLDTAYPLGDHRDDGWDTLISFEEIARVLRNDPASLADITVLEEASQPANSFNKAIPSAVQFWKDYVAFQQTFHRDVPVFVDTQKGSRAGGVWPSFYENQLRSNKSEPRRKRIQIVHIDNSDHVSLFVKKVRYPDFVAVVSNLLETEMVLAKPGGSWQSIQIKVPRIGPTAPLEGQTERLDGIFQAARRLYEFFEQHEAALLNIPVLVKTTITQDRSAVAR